MPLVKKYIDLDGTQLQIEGPYYKQDLSYSLITQCDPLKRLEQGIPFDPYLLLLRGCSVKDDSIYAQSLNDFQARLNARNSKVEMSLLNRLNCHKEKFDKLYKNFNSTFVEKNRYPDMLPFRFNRVTLTKNLRPFQKLRRKPSKNQVDPQDSN